MEATSEGGQGPEGAVVPWMDGLQYVCLSVYYDIFDRPVVNMELIMLI